MKNKQKTQESLLRFEAPTFNDECLLSRTCVRRNALFIPTDAFVGLDSFRGGRELRARVEDFTVDISTLVLLPLVLAVHLDLGLLICSCKDDNEKVALRNYNFEHANKRAI